VEALELVDGILGLHPDLPGQIGLVKHGALLAVSSTFRRLPKGAPPLVVTGCRWFVLALIVDVRQDFPVTFPNFMISLPILAE